MPDKHRTPSERDSDLLAQRRRQDEVERGSGAGRSEDRDKKPGQEQERTT